MPVTVATLHLVAGERDLAGVGADVGQVTSLAGDLQRHRGERRPARSGTERVTSASDERAARPAGRSASPSTAELGDDRLGRAVLRVAATGSCPRSSRPRQRRAERRASRPAALRMVRCRAGRRCRGSGRAARRCCGRRSSTPGMKEARSSESWRIVSVSPSAPNSTSWWAIRPRSRTLCTWMPSTSAPRAPGRPVAVASGTGPSPASRACGCDPSRGRLGGAGGRVHLVRVVELDDLGGLVEAGGLLGEVHHQHGADGEVGGDQRRPTSGLAASWSRTSASRSSVKPVVPTTTWMPLLDAPGEVVHHGVRRGEVDDDVGVCSTVAAVVTGVDGRHELEVGGCLDRPAHLGTHPALGPEHRNPHRAPLPVGPPILDRLWSRDRQRSHGRTARTRRDAG